MDIDWTIPTQHGRLDPGVDPNTTYPQSLEEHNALDPTLWGDVPVPPIYPWPDSEDMTGLEPYSDMDFGCVCDLPPLYCEQHGAYGGISTDIGLPLPFFGLEQTVASPGDVMESSEPVLAPLALTRETLTCQFTSQDLFEMGHAKASMPTNDKSDSPYMADASPSPTKLPAKQRLRRSKISSRDRRILREQLSINPYPRDSELAKLHKGTGLALKCIKTWFINTRHRTAHGGSPFIPMTRKGGDRQLSETPSQASTSVSAENLRELDRMSPARSTNSLERYLAAPLTEEAVPSASIGSLLEAHPANGCDTAAESEKVRLAYLKRQLESLERIVAMPETLRSTLRKYGFAGSVAGSDSSMESGNSVGSWASSVGSRGSRKGRRCFTNVSGLFKASPKANDNDSATVHQPPNPKWYCTSPNCDKSFGNRSGWDRHEAGVHHWPHVWVCKLDEENQTVHKNGETRIFYRHDNLLAHLKRAHKPEQIIRGSTYTRSVNPDSSPAALWCGFCRLSLPDWETRQSHVAGHLEYRLLKSMWLPQALAYASRE